MANDKYKVMLKGVRLCFAQGLFNKSAPIGFPNAKAKYNASFLIPKGSEAEKLARAAYLECAKDAFGDAFQTTLKRIEHDNKTNCFLSADMAPGDKEGFDDTMMVLSAKNDVRPTLLAGDAKTPVAEEDDIIYSGCLVNASVCFWAQSGKHTGMRCEIRGVMYAGEGDRFTAGGGAAAKEEFADLSVSETGDKDFY